MDYLEYNREAWNRQVEDKNIWTLPVNPEAIAAARKGEWALVLTPIKKCPARGTGRRLWGRMCCVWLRVGGSKGRFCLPRVPG